MFSSNFISSNQKKWKLQVSFMSSPRVFPVIYVKQREVKVANIVSCLPHVVFLLNSNRRTRPCKHPSCLYRNFVFSIQKEVKVVSIPLSSTLFCLVERESKSCKHLSQTPNVFYTFASNKACDPPPIWFEAKKLQCYYYYFHEAFVWLSIWFSFGVLLLLETGHYWLPYYLGSFDTKYIIFKNVENFPKKILIKEKLWNKILNLQEYFICQNELIIQQIWVKTCQGTSIYGSFNFIVKCLSGLGF